MMNSKISGHVAALMTGLLTAVALLAAPALAAQRVTVEKNHTLRVSLAGSAGSVIVGNPDIADVTVVDSHTLYIVGKGFGSSAVTVTDQAGRPLFDGEVMVTAAQQGAVTVYKGLTPSTVVCSTICTPEDPQAAAAGRQGSPGPNLSAAAMPVAMAAQ